MALIYPTQRILLMMGHASVILLIVQANWLTGLMNRFRAVGQMAFTNYLGQSLICGILFYSVGFKLYGRLDRAEVYLTVLAIWIFQIIFFHIWLRYFRFGPFEWLWRSLTYWKRQPMLRD